jgi:capsular exopolysaccharide synthesis family protein
MSKFTKALEQAQRERAMRLQAAAPARPAAAPAAGASAPPPPAAPPSSVNGAPRRSVATQRRSAVITGEVESHLVSLVSPTSVEAEQYRALRHVVEQRHKSQELTVIAISSPGVGDGKTTTAINLAGALAQGSDASVLLVEADLRRPSIGHVLGFDGSRTLGLVDAILDPGLTLASIVQPRPPFNLNVVLAGQIPPSPYEVLKSPRLGALLDEARRQYDFIIMDTPPLALVQDCRVVARWVDGMVVVVHAHQTPRALLESALDVVDPTKLIGIVFNGFDDLRPGHHGRQYAGYYESPGTENRRRRGPLKRFSRKLGSMLRRDEGVAARSRRSRDRSR